MNEFMNEGWKERAAIINTTVQLYIRLHVFVRMVLSKPKRVRQYNTNKRKRDIQ